MYITVEAEKLYRVGKIIILNIMKNLLFTILCILLITSCSKENENIAVEGNESKDINFVYKGINYTASIDFQEAKELFEELQELPDLATFVSENVLYLFDNFKEMDEYCRAGLPQNTESLDTRSGVPPRPPVPSRSWVLYLYKGAGYTKTLEGYEGTQNLRQNRVSLNNDISSLKFENRTSMKAWFTIYEHANCGNDGGRSKRWECISGGFVWIPNLKDVHRSNWGRNWNDHISSFTVELFNQ